MDNIDLFGYHWFVNKNKIVIAFEGVISQEILVNLAEMIKQRVSAKDKKEVFARKIFGIFIELSQNIQRYSAEKELYMGKELGNGSVIALDMEDYYYITSCNKVKNNEIEKVTSHCEHINNLNKEELKKLYKETLKKSEREKANSGGIGLIEMVRKTGNKIGYKVVEVDNTISYLIISLKINKEAGNKNA